MTPITAASSSTRGHTHAHTHTADGTAQHRRTQSQQAYDGKQRLKIDLFWDDYGTVSVSPKLNNVAKHGTCVNFDVIKRSRTRSSVPLRATYYSAKNLSLRHSVLLARSFRYEAFAYVDTTVC